MECSAVSFLGMVGSISSCKGFRALKGEALRIRGGGGALQTKEGEGIAFVLWFLSLLLGICFWYSIELVDFYKSYVMTRCCLYFLIEYL